MVKAPRFCLPLALPGKVRPLVTTNANGVVETRSNDVNRLSVDRPNAASRRREALRGTETMPGLDRDEFPPAMF